jgi:glyoxylase-like metal-dependent hydrolase (beta-lactamase superfamily II)
VSGFGRPEADRPRHSAGQDAPRRNSSPEALLARAADSGIHCLRIPTPFLVGRVNCWLIEDEPLTLVDTGPNSGKALDELEQALAAHGHRVEDLELIVISHQHMDHLGLIDILARRSGADVAALDRLAPWLADYSKAMEGDDEFSLEVMLRHGVSEEVALSLRATAGAIRSWGSSAAVTRPLADGSRLELSNRSFAIHHRPGHSPSDTVLHDEQRGILIGADHLIKHISSNPLVSRPLEGGTPDNRPQALVMYLESLEATRAMDGVELVLTGHGDPIDDHAALIDERFRMHERRARKIARLIAQRPRTAHEIAKEMWGSIAITQAYLTLSEVLGHVDVLLNEGVVVEDPGTDGVVRFTAQ